MIFNKFEVFIFDFVYLETFFKNLFDFALSSKAIIPIFDAAWKSTSDNPEFSSDKRKSDFLYLFALVLIDSLTRGSNV